MYLFIKNLLTFPFTSMFRQTQQPSVP